MIEVIIGFLYVFAVLGAATLLEKLNVFSDEGNRKFIHIGVSNWWLLAMVLFDQTWLAMIAPLTFIVLNFLSYRFNLLSAMERDTKSSNDLGTVYYAISLSIITYFAFEMNALEAGAVAILTMGYGDGLSAVLGQKLGKFKLYKNKSLIGALTVFIVTLILGLIWFSAMWYWMIALALLAMLIELFTPKGLDNLSLPLIVFLILVLL